MRLRGRRSLTREDEALLAYFRQKPFCEMCRARSPGRLDPHHVLGRGEGGGSRLDTALGLVSLCPGLYGGQCHVRYGDDPNYVDYFLDLIARREGLANGAAVKEALERLLRRPESEINGYLESDA